MRAPFLLFALVSLPSAALAHGSTQPHHGGTLVMVDGEVQVEAVRVPEGLDIYVSEEDQPHEATGLEGSVVVKDLPASRVALTPMDANRLRAAGMTPAAGQTIIVTITDKATGVRSFATFQY
ncbi:MAG: hypothetical protein ABI673_03740 [Novosphingobium sp.]